MTQPIQEPNTPRRLSSFGYGQNQLFRRPAPIGGGGLAIYEIKVFEDVNVVVVGDGKFYWPIPEDLDAGEIIKVEAGVSTVSSSGPTQVQIAHQVGGSGAFSDILSTKITIDVGEKNSKDAVTQPVISGGLWTVAHGDWLRIDIDAAGTGAKGLALMVTITPSPLGSVTIAGAKGDPGGVTAWEGPWVTSTGYTAGDVVNVGGTTYVARINHTSGASSEPGVGGSWQTYWMVLAGGHTVSALVVTIANSGDPIDVGTKAVVPVYFNCTIVEATILANTAGSAVVNIYKDTYGVYPPTVADKITSASPPTLASAIKSTDTTLTGWTTAIAAGDVLLFTVDSLAGITQLTVSLKIARS